MLQQSQDVAQQVNSIVDHLATRLAVPAGKLWDVLVAQGRAQAIVAMADIGYALVLLAALIFGARAALRRADACEDSDYAIGIRIITLIAGAVLCLVCVIVIGSGIDNAISYSLNPAGYAIDTFTKALGK